ncbi:hypothetical protein ACRE_024730 [Hapsidospora chrysogenum ATCC 11550]|uniref:Uncharacterized protein n=1 Tax=Hapsidospora chrysogenum (strain ATCC 11550 / CBS 779.69 / DSM 880 / IAM 14645 / JCM 23072 / IMI 49137) TaxID=857340 RepID=A0A086TBK8_HAPC1|nr:hypothetical protein ACRE_024730 [Hapsidospora chrysogenum ATCC 11550]
MSSKHTTISYSNCKYSRSTKGYSSLLHLCPSSTSPSASRSNFISSNRIAGNIVRVNAADFQEIAFLESQHSYTSRFAAKDNRTGTSCLCEPQSQYHGSQ